MNRLLSILLGPELFWTILYLGCRWLAARNDPPTSAGNALLNGAIWVAVLVAVPLSFASLSLPGVNRWIMFARLAVAAFIGLNACVFAACDGIKYPEPGRDSGLMALWMMAIVVGGLVWCVSAVISLLILRAKAAGGAPPLLP